MSKEDATPLPWSGHTVFFGPTGKGLSAVSSDEMKAPGRVAEADTWPNWANWSTIVQIEFFHIKGDPHAPDDPARLGPCPDNLYAGLNTDVKAVTSNGVLVWLPDGSVVHCDWMSERLQFSRRDGAANLALSDIRAWAALPQPIATS